MGKSDLKSFKLAERKEYGRFYGDFRGVDFSTDNTQIDERRFAYLVNMWKNYYTDQGVGIETIPGFRRVYNAAIVDKNTDNTVYAIHTFDKVNTDGNVKKYALFHVGNRLYVWDFEQSTNVKKHVMVTITETSQIPSGYKIHIPDNVDVGYVDSIVIWGKEEIENKSGSPLSLDGNVLTYQTNRDDLFVGQYVTLNYREKVLNPASSAAFTGMEPRKSASFTLNNRLYVIDGKNYLVFDGERIFEAATEDTAYVPTTYRFAVPSGVNADAGKEWEARNLLSPYFKMTFVGDGVATEFHLNEEAESIAAVTVDGQNVTDYKFENGMVTFTTPPTKASPEGSDNVVIKAKKWWRGFDGGLNGNAETSKDMILGCTIATVFDSRVFFSGNPNYPNHVFWCGLNSTGYVDPTYFGAINYQLDGVGNSPVTGMIAVADSLMVLKRDAENGGSVFYHTPLATEGVDVITKVYPMAQGLNSTGCLGACTSFLDDPVFVSRLGLEAMGQLSVRYERAVEHRSHLVDSMLTKCDLSSAVLDECGGYLFLLVDGKVFLADSRQRYTHQSGHMQYEWYYLEDVGVWENQYEEAVYASEIPLSLQKPDGSGIDIHYCTSCGRPVSRCENPYQHEGEGAHVTMPLLIADNVFDFDTYTYMDKRGKTANPPRENGKGAKPEQDVIITKDDKGNVITVNYVDFMVDGENAYLVNVNGNYIGGTFRKAITLKAISDTVYFGTESGDICAFNFDQRNAHGEIPTDAYSFDERTIYCGCATKMDNCGVPHLTKNTVRKSLVVKTKAMGRYAAKLKVRTNKKPYEQIARITSGSFAFDDVDFSDFTFSPNGETLFAIKEKEKRWVEKQYYFYSDEYLKPFSLYYVAFRYSIMGRYKG